MPQINLGAQIHIEQEQRRRQIKHHVPHKRRRLERKGRGVNRHKPHHERRHESAGGQNRAEPGSVLPRPDRRDRGKDVRGAVSEREEGDGGHAGGQIEGKNELGGDEREVILRCFDEDVEEEEEDKREGGEREKWVLAEEAEVEVEVVKEAIGVGYGGGGARWGFCCGGDEGPVERYGRWVRVVWGIGSWGCEEEEEEEGEERE